MSKNLIKKLLVIILIYTIMFPLIANIFNFSNHVNAIESSIVVDKYVSPVGNTSNEFLLTLEAYINGNASNIQIEKVEIPTDIVLVVDQSSSMASNNLGSVTRLAAVKTALRNFVNDVHAKAIGTDGAAGTDDDVNHRIAMVGFAQSNPPKKKFENTELFVGATQHNYLNLTEDIYKQAFQDMNTTTGKTNVDNSVNALAANLSTFVDKGVEIANGVLANNPIPAGELRKRVVIVIMDGQPGSQGRWGYEAYGENGNDGTTVANIVLPLIYETKNTYGADVYTIGVFSSADGSIPAPTPNWNDGKSSDTNKDNAFMHYLSSNFKNATSVSNPGTPTYPEEGSFYLSALNTTELNNIFTSIYEQKIVGPDADLDETTILKDIISTNFNLPEDATALDVKVYTALYQGDGTFAEKTVFEDAVVNIYKDSESGLDVVEVTGFNYFENCVIDENSIVQGAKIIVEIPIVTASSNSGGNVQYTNDSSSGIYDSTGEVLEVFLVEKFPVPAVDTPTTVTLKHIIESPENDSNKLEFKSDYIEFVEYIEETTESGNYLKALGKDSSKTATLGNNESEIIEEVLLNNDFKISNDLLSGYEISKVVIDSPNIEEYELQPDENGEYVVDVIKDMNITIYTNKAKKNIVVEKIWEDNENYNNSRPDNIIIELLQNENPIKELELSSDNWSGEFSGLEIYDLNGDEYIYTVKEKEEIEGYYVKEIEEQDDHYKIINTKFGNILINKFDNLTKEPLEGAVFKVELQNGDNIEVIGEYTTDSDGKVNVKDLKQGLYKITEIHVPEGYKLTEETYEISIDTNNFEYELNVPNKKQMNLPIAGGNGIKNIIISGLILMIFSGIIQNKKIYVIKKSNAKKKRKKGYRLKHNY